MYLAIQRRVSSNSKNVSSNLKECIYRDREMYPAT
ncbi:hypothetical protein KSS87_017862 [Heliosperma pusillum]|nr:hypothetical protein KSS87_017862 [Heliosperma pusillum]